jgi:3-hydroxy-9,10-secoandrosta-1,3,5(10)-triene-9,17-dione monooxygenase
MVRGITRPTGGSQSRHRQAEVFKLAQPAAFVGFEYGLSELAQIAFELGRVCGSTGWCGSLGMCYQWMTSFFSLEAQRDVWSDRDNIVAGCNFTPSKDGEIVPGGIKLAGTWPYASNCENSQWLQLGAAIPNLDGPPTVVWCVIRIQPPTNANQRLEVREFGVDNGHNYRLSR